MRWLFLLITTSLFSMTITDSLLKGEVGDFVVFEQNKLTTILSIHSINEHSLILEEVSLPSHLSPKDWHKFSPMRSREVLSHLIYEIDPTTQEVTECYSFTKKTFLPPPSFLLELIKLPLSPCREPKKIGSPPEEGTVDRRALWTPPLIIEGVKKRPDTFSILNCSWPLDKSELSGEQITLYLVPESPFPIYLSVNTPHYTYKISSINNGKHLRSFCDTLPRRSPTFIGSLIRSPSVYTLKLASPTYYRTYTLTVLNHETGETFSITPELLREGEVVTLTFPKEALEKNHSYTFLAVPDGFPNYYAESPTTKL